MVFWWNSVGAQQTVIRVLDSGSGESLPSAHVKFTSQKNGKSEYVLTNLKGEAAMPYTSDFSERINVYVSFIGFEPASFVVNQGEMFTIKLEESASSLHQIVVTGQLSADNPEKSVNSVSIITDEKIAALNAVTLDQVLARELNMNIQQDGVLGSSISIQGLSGENVKILVDGVPMIGRLNGSIDLSQINLSDVERIEVIEGPLSVSYGSNALAGTINIITKKEQQKAVSGNVKTYAENIGTFNVDGSVGMSKGKNFGSINFTRNFFDGWNIGDPVFGQPAPIADSSRAKLWKPRTQLIGGLKYGRNLKKGSVIYSINAFNETILNRGLPRGPYQESAFDDKYITQRLDQNINYDYKIDSTKTLNILGAYNYYDRQRLSYITDLTGVSSIENPNEEVNDTTTTTLAMLRPTFTAKPLNKNWRYQIGLDLNYETATGQRILDQKQSIGDFAAYTSFEYEPGIRWTIRPGVRLSYNTQYGAPVVPSINVKFNPKPGWAIRGALARGFRAPSVKELYLDFVDINHDIQGNSNLEAETAVHSSLNLTYSKIVNGRRFQVKSGVFYNKINNKIALAQASTTQYVYANVDEAIALGADVEGEVNIGHFKWSAGFSYIGNKNTITESQVQPEIAFYPQVTSSLTYDFQKAKANISFFLKYTGDVPQFVIDENQQIDQQFLGSYTLLDGTASKKFWKERLILGAGVKNILNVTNITASAPGGAHGGGNGTRPIAPGRVYFVKLGLQF